MPGRQSKSSSAIAVFLADDDLNALPMPSAAGSDASGVPKAPTYTALGYRQVTATGTVFTLPTPPAGARRAIIQAEAQAIRWRDDATDPTATVGMTIPAGGELRYDGASMAAWRGIAATAGAIANIAYYS